MPLPTHPPESVGQEAALASGLRPGPRRGLRPLHPQRRVRPLGPEPGSAPYAPSRGLPCLRGSQRAFRPLLPESGLVPCPPATLARRVLGMPRARLQPGFASCAPSRGLALPRGPRAPGGHRPGPPAGVSPSAPRARLGPLPPATRRWPCARHAPCAALSRSQPRRGLRPLHTKPGLAPCTLSNASPAAYSTRLMPGFQPGCTSCAPSRACPASGLHPGPRRGLRLLFPPPTPAPGPQLLPPSRGCPLVGSTCIMVG